MTMFCPPSSETRNSAKNGERERKRERTACLFFSISMDNFGLQIAMPSVKYIVLHVKVESIVCEHKLMFITKHLDKNCIVHLCFSLLNKPD